MYLLIYQAILEVAKQVIVKDHAFAKEVERTRRKKIVEKREELAREKGERKNMLAEDKYMKKFLEDEKAYLEEQEKKAAEEAAKEEGGGEEQA